MSAKHSYTMTVMIILGVGGPEFPKVERLALAVSEVPDIRVFDGLGFVAAESAALQSPAQQELRSDLLGDMRTEKASEAHGDINGLSCS